MRAVVRPCVWLSALAVALQAAGCALVVLEETAPGIGGAGTGGDETIDPAGGSGGDPGTGAGSSSSAAGGTGGVATSTSAGGAGSAGAGGTTGTTGAGGAATTGVGGSGGSGGGGTTTSTGAGGSGGSGVGGNGGTGGTGGGGSTTSSSSSSTTSSTTADCDPCGPGEVCNPVSGACECAPGGLQPGAAWPMVGFDATRRGLSPFVGAQTATIQWSTPLGNQAKNGTRAITIDAGGTLYVPAATELRAYNPGGQLQWSVPMEGAYTPPAIGLNGTLYQQLIFGGGLRALDPADGSTLWTVDGFPTEYSHLAIGGDGMIVFASGLGVSAVSPCGDPLWSMQLGDFGVASSAAITDAGITLTQRNGLYAIDPEGAVVWQQPLLGSLESPTIGPDGKIYAGSGAELRAFDDAGVPLWSVTLGSGPASLTWIAIGPDGTLYVIDSYSDTAIHAVNPQSGTVLWSHAKGGNHGAPPVVGANGVVYAALHNSLFAYMPDGTELWTLNQGSCGPVTIGADGTTYVICGSTLYALGP